MGKEIMYIREKGRERGEPAACPHCGKKDLRMLPKGLVLPDVMELLALLLFGTIATVILSEGVLEILDQGWILRLGHEQMADCRVPVQTVTGIISYILVYLGMRGHIQRRQEKDGITARYAWCRRCEWVYRVRRSAGTEMTNVWVEKSAKRPESEETEET